MNVIEAGTLRLTKADPRNARVGAVLRGTNIDERRSYQCSNT